MTLVFNKAWAAGFFDGEGCMTLTRQKETPNSKNYAYHPIVALSSSDKAAISMFKRRYGGRLSFGSRKGTQHRSGLYWCHVDTYNWYCPVHSILRLITELLPYMRVKNTQARLLARFVNVRQFHRTFAGSFTPVSEMLKRERFYLQFKTLNSYKKRGRKDLNGA